ncbi:unannotated protein [freshwater metagenome]|uniref:Unannotated protein n=1 Tax=freshwater metagenome TaxID=449393 RepID=A0A6J7PBV1_9ZZZZ
MTTIPLPRRANIKTGTHIGLTFLVLGVGGVYLEGLAFFALAFGVALEPDFAGLFRGLFEGAFLDRGLGFGTGDTLPADVGVMGRVRFRA